MGWWHYTCAHHASAIERDGFVRPRLSWAQLDAAWLRIGWKPTGLVSAPSILWLTDMPEPQAEPLGLTSNFIDCDRTEFRIEVADHPRIQPWDSFAKQYGAEREWRASLEHGRNPERWFVCTIPVRVLSVASTLSSISARGEASL